MTVDQSWKGVYKSGGLSLFAGGAILVIFLLSVFIFRVALPLTPQAVLENPMPPVTLYLLAALGELLLLPAALGLYLSLKDVNKNYMLIAAASWSVAVTMYLVWFTPLIWRTGIGDARQPHQIHAKFARPFDRSHQRQGWKKRIRADTGHPRTTYPARKGNLQYLHQQQPLRTDSGRLHGLIGRKRLSRTVAAQS